jgi:hypothetical protein
MDHEPLVEPFSSTDGILRHALLKIEAINLSTQFKELFLSIVPGNFTAGFAFYNSYFFNHEITPEGGALSFCI